MTNKKCFHCDLPIYDSNNYDIIINGTIKNMCCIGCLSVAKFIINSGFSDYYLYRSSYNIKIDEKLFKINNSNLNDNVYNSKNSIILSIEGITCSACTWLIERYLKNLNGINNVYVNLLTCKAHIVFDFNIIKTNDIINKLKNLGFLSYLYTYQKHENKNKNEYKKEIKNLIISSIVMSQVMMLSIAIYIGEAMDMHKNYWIFIRWSCFFFTIPLLFFSGKKIIINAYKSILLNSFSMDVTITLSIAIAFFISLWNIFLNFGDIYFDSICMFIFFLQVSRFLEMKSRYHATNIISGLQNLIINNVNILHDKNKIKNVSIDNVKIDDIIVVNPEEIIPVDGIIINDGSNINESMLTGESNPILKLNNDYVFSGTLNLDKILIIKTTKIKGFSTIDIIIQLLEKNTFIKPKHNLLIDFISLYFVVIVIVLTFLSSVIWLKIESENLLNIILCMFVVACPCALSLATPIALMNTINNLAKKGFFIIKEHVLENLNLITDIVFDKTGTLTINNFIINKIKLNRNINILEVMKIAFLLENSSSHPISKAFLQFKKYLNHEKKKTYTIKYFSSNGIEGNINGNCYRIGNENFIKNWTTNFKNHKFNEIGTNIILADKKSIISWFNIKNPLRNNITECIQNLQNLNLNLHILSGDSQDVVDDISKKLNITNKYGKLNSEDKLNYIKNLKLNNSKILMIGDGINDSLALSNSDISIAMGNSSDLIKISSDIIILNNNLINIYTSLKCAKNTRIIIKQNIIWSIIYNIIALILASFNLLTPYYAAIGMSLSSLMVVLNSLRLKNI